MASNWAGTDFTLENGATRVVPGSHRWPKGREAEEHEVAQAAMPKGSVVFWLGGTLHGAGASRCTLPRTGFILTLVVNWLVAEENQYLTVPPPIALTLPERTQQLLGYRSSSSLGWVAGLSGENLLVRGGSPPSNEPGAPGAPSPFACDPSMAWIATARPPSSRGCRMPSQTLLGPLQPWFPNTSGGVLLGQPSSTEASMPKPRWCLIFQTPSVLTKSSTERAMIQHLRSFSR